MPDVFANISEAPPQALQAIASTLELRASIPQQQDMLESYLRDIDFPAGAHVLEVGCGTGAVARVVAAWPNVRHVVGVDPSPFLVERACALSAGASNLTFEIGDGRALAFKDASLIGKELAAALRAEAKRRADSNVFFGYMAYASMIARKSR